MLDPIEAMSALFAKQRAKKLESKLASLVTDVCNSCLGSGTLQFCGGETCPECNGTGDPPTEVKVYECYLCGTQSLDEDTNLFATCPHTHNLHQFHLKTIYTKVTKNAS